MTAAAIVADLAGRGVTLRVAGEWIDYEAPRGVLTIDDLAILRRHKPALLAYLAGSRPGNARVARPELATPRPGDDPAFGIVIDRTDRARMLEAVGQLPEGPGDADESGLEDHPRWIDSPPEFHPIDFESPDCPAWVFDDSLAVRPSDLRVALEANARMGG